MTVSTRRNNCLILGVAGGSGSGKTYFSRALAERLGAERAVILSQDSFYRDQSAQFDHDGGSINFDHPEAIDFTLMGECLEKIRTNPGQSVDIPVYDFATHKRLAEPQKIQARPVVIVDGILIFQSARVRAELDDLLFFDTNEALRYERRLKRDVEERGRTPEGVKKQFFRQVKPMHDLYVEPTKIFANKICSREDEFDALLQHYLTLCL